MSEILGYGEDAFTFWALKGHLSEILAKLNDKTKPSDCLIFFRPGFGRSGVAEFGEFDAILASSQSIYLIESKWDRLMRSRRDEIALTSNQILRHKIFSWYLANWDGQRYSGNLGKFKNDFESNFTSTTNFADRKLAPSGSHLVKNLEFILSRLQEHCRRFSYEYKPRNVLPYFHKNESIKIERVVAEGLSFKVVNIDYSKPAFPISNWVRRHLSMVK